MTTETIMAKFAIARAQKASTTEKILAEILRLYPANIIDNPRNLSGIITKNLNLTHECFRQHSNKLYRLDLIMKHGTTIIINPTIRKAFTNGK